MYGNGWVSYIYMSLQCWCQLYFILLSSSLVDSNSSIKVNLCWKDLYFFLKMPPLDSHIMASYGFFSSLSFIHSQHSMLSSQALSRYDFTIQTNFYVWFPNIKEIYLRTFHKTLVYDKIRCSSLFLKQVLAKVHEKSIGWIYLPHLLLQSHTPFV
jgi:hypothetical protein